MKQKYWRTWNVEWGTKSVDLAIRSLEASKIFESSLQESAALTTYNSLLLHISPGPATIFLNWWTETSLRINQRHRNQQMLSWRKNDDFIHWTNKPREDLFHCLTDESTCWPFLLPETNANQIPYCAELNIIFHACLSTDQSLTNNEIFLPSLLSNLFNCCSWEWDNSFLYVVGLTLHVKTENMLVKFASIHQLLLVSDANL